MRLPRGVGLLFAAVTVLTSIGIAESDAFPRRGRVTPTTPYAAPVASPVAVEAGVGTIAQPPVIASPGMVTAPMGGVVPLGATAWLPMYNPYSAPFPIYNILPPTLPYGYQGTAGYGYGYQGGYPGQRTAEDYGYSRQDFDGPPRKRPATDPQRVAPPVAQPLAKPEDAQADLRRVRFEITVPTDDAIVIFDGTVTKQQGRLRVFMTPPLQDDRIYSSTLEIRWMKEGKEQTTKEAFDFVPGDTVRYPLVKKSNP